MFRLLVTITAFALLNTAGLAQEASPPAQEVTPPAQSAVPTTPPQASTEASDLRKVKDEKRMIAPWNLRVEDVEDMDVDGPAGKEVGEVEDVLEDANGEIRAVVVEYGGFLGFGASQVVVPLDQLRPDKGRRFSTDLTEDQLSAMPAWNK